MEAYLRAFVNFEQNDWARFLPMAKFVYNNTKNASTGYTPFELNCRYHFQASYKENINLRSQSKSVGKLAIMLKKLITVCKKNLQHT